jgi:hypothetical protein
MGLSQGVPDTASRAWAVLTALCLPREDLKDKHGLTFLWSPEQNELRLIARGCTLVITRAGSELTAVLHKDGTTLERRFRVAGIDYPLLVEDAGSRPKRISEVFGELIANLREPSS